MFKKRLLLVDSLVNGFGRQILWGTVRGGGGAEGGREVCAGEVRLRQHAAHASVKQISVTVRHFLNVRHRSHQGVEVLHTFLSVGVRKFPPAHTLQPLQTVLIPIIIELLKYPPRLPSSLPRNANQVLHDQSLLGLWRCTVHSRRYTFNNIPEVIVTRCGTESHDGPVMLSDASSIAYFEPVLAPFTQAITFRNQTQLAQGFIKAAIRTDERTGCKSANHF